LPATTLIRSGRIRAFEEKVDPIEQNGTQIGAMKVWLAMILGTLSSYSWNPPLSRVADVQEEVSSWSNNKTGTVAKRKKIRYGPFRAPPISVGFLEELAKVHG
jgi:hypothetical protein